MALLALLALPSCLQPLEGTEENHPPLLPGEAREVELYALALEVRGFEQRLTKPDILNLPPLVRERLWLLDLSLVGSAEAPGMIDSTLEQIRRLDPEDPSLGRPEANMVRLLNTTPDNAQLDGTAFAELLDISLKIGIPAPALLAESLGVAIQEPYLPEEVVRDSIVRNLIETHPNVRTRPGPMTRQNPEGVYPVEPGHIPITLEDGASDMATLSVKLGPCSGHGVAHPGFIVAASETTILSDDFALTIRANPNALPYKGVDLTDASVGSVGSIASQKASLFDFTDPQWLTIEGLPAEAPVVSELTFQILEDKAFHPVEHARYPLPAGGSAIWDLPPWTLERIIMDGALAAFGERTFYQEYTVGTSAEPAVVFDLQDGWMTIHTLANMGTPPAPLYIWDLFAEIVQIRLHDGPDPEHPDEGRLAEGEASVRFTLHDVPVGVTPQQIEQTIRANLEDDPAQLVDVAALLFDNSSGRPDFTYYRSRNLGTPGSEGDYLLYLAPSDIPVDANGWPVRPHEAYTRPGFYAEAELINRISGFWPLDGDEVHEKVRISPGDALFTQDDEGAGFRIDVLDKPGDRRVRLRITRLW